MPLAADDHVIELNAVRAGAVVSRLGDLFEPVEAHGLGRKVLIALAFDDVLAIGDDFAVNYRLHRPCSCDAVHWPNMGLPAEAATGGNEYQPNEKRSRIRCIPAATVF